MREHALIVPTCVGPAGAVVTEPAGRQRGAAVVLHGLGPPARAGVNAVWTHLARDLAALGLAVLRFDFACEGDSTLAGTEVERDIGWRRSTDLAMLRDIAPWFLDRAGERELFVVGSCHGGRVALEHAAHDPSVCGLFLVTPYLWHREPHLGRVPGDDEPPELTPVWANGPVLSTDTDIVGAFRTALSRGPVWVLTGEGGGEGEVEADHVLPFARRVEESGTTFELEVERGMAIHPVGHPEQQARVRRRVPSRVAGALAARERSATPSR